MQAAMPLGLVLCYLASYVYAQTPTASEGQFSIATVGNPVSKLATTWPVVSIFLPSKIPEHLGASVVSVGALQTIFAVNCMTKAACKYNKDFRLTAGQSTFIATNTFLDPEGSADSPQTISCELSGASTATSATCTGCSVISGLGTVASTATYNRAEITHAPLTITAGAQKLKNPPTSESSSSSSSAQAAEITATVSLVMGGAAAAALLCGAF